MGHRPLNYDIQTIANNLRTLRRLHGYSQGQVAVQLGVSFQQVQKYETGVNRISAASLGALARMWGVPVVLFYPDT